jgi:hypothetical protein
MDLRSGFEAERPREAQPIEVADYAVTNGIDTEPALPGGSILFAKKRTRIKAMKRSTSELSLSSALRSPRLF